MDVKDSQSGRKIGIIEERLGAGISADPFGGAATFLTQGSQVGDNSDIEITSYDPEGIKWSRHHSTWMTLP